MHQVSLCIALYLKALGQTKINLEQINVILSQFMTNAITIYDDEFVSMGIGLFPLLAMLNHSCSPNAFVSFNHLTKSAEIRSLCEIRQGEQLFISYSDITMPKRMRKQELMRAYHFDCNCSVCTKRDESMCIALCCKKCGSELGNDLLDEYECLNKQCRKKYKKQKLRRIVDEIETKYCEINRDVAYTNE